MAAPVKVKKLKHMFLFTVNVILHCTIFRVGTLRRSEQYLCRSNARLTRISRRVDERDCCFAACRQSSRWNGAFGAGGTSPAQHTLKVINNNKDFHNRCEITTHTHKLHTTLQTKRQYLSRRRRAETVLSVGYSLSNSSMNSETTSSGTTTHRKAFLETTRNIFRKDNG